MKTSAASDFHTSLSDFSTYNQYDELDRVEQELEQEKILETYRKKND